MTAFRLAAMVLVCICALTSATAFAQAFPDLRGPYLGQTPPGNTAQLFAPDIVSKLGRFEYALGFSPAGDRLLFSVQEGEVVQLYHTQILDGVWTEPAPVSLSADQFPAEMEAFFAPDAERVFFAPYHEGLDVRIFQVTVDGDRWVDPVALDGPFTDTPAFFPTCTNDGTVYYTNLAERKVFRARQDKSGQWQAEPAGLEFGGHAFVSPDESFVLLDARADDSLGEGDIYVAFAQEDGNWTRPVNLGAGINSAFSESCPSLSADGRYLFFSRYEEEGGLSQIYWADAKVVSEARATEK